MIDICKKAEACICLSTVGALCHDQATAAAIECAYGAPLLYNGQVVLLDREAVEGCVNDWIDRIGWPRFFEITGLPFTKFHIDNWRGARKSLNASTHIRF